MCLLSTICHQLSSALTTLSLNNVLARENFHWKDHWRDYWGTIDTEQEAIHFCNHLWFWDNSVASAWLDQGTRYFIFLNIVQAWCDSTVKFETRERQYSDEFQQGENLIMFQSIHLHLASNPSPSVLGLKIYWSLNFRSPPQNSIWK